MAATSLIVMDFKGSRVYEPMAIGFKRDPVAKDTSARTQLVAISHMLSYDLIKFVDLTHFKGLGFGSR